MLNRILNIIRKKRNSRTIAKNRLRFILTQDRAFTRTNAEQEGVFSSVAWAGK